MTNANVISKFVAGEPARANSLTSEEDRYGPAGMGATVLKSYSTPIAYLIGDVCYVNPERYSVTSSAHREAVKRELGRRLPDQDRAFDVSGRGNWETVTFHAYHVPYR